MEISVTYKITISVISRPDYSRTFYLNLRLIMQYESRSNKLELIMQHESHSNRLDNSIHILEIIYGCNPLLIHKIGIYGVLYTHIYLIYSIVFFLKDIYIYIYTHPKVEIWYIYHIQSYTSTRQFIPY